MNQTSSRLILLLFVLLTACFFDLVAAKHCDSNHGYKSKECDDDHFCCETNGKVECCTVSELWWVWTLIAISLGLLIPLTIIAVTLCCCFCLAHKRRRTSDVVQPVTSTVSSTSSESETLKKPCISINIDAPPSYYDISQYLQVKSPPPYPGT